MQPDAVPFSAAFDRTRALSQFVARVAAAKPAVIEELEARAARAYTREEMRASLAPGEALGSALRGLRERVMVTLAHRDLNGLAPLDEVFATMTALAEECIAAAAAEAQRRSTERYGAPSEGDCLSVAALGKLGGCELNVSSDVDLVFVYGSDGETTGSRPVSHHEYFAHAARTRYLEAGTIVGSGTVANRDAAAGCSCIAERRVRETIDSGKPTTPFMKFGDHIRIEMLDRAGKSIFGAIDQKVVKYDLPG